MLDDSCDDRRRAESGTDAGEAAVCFDADERRITLDLGSKVGAVAVPPERVPTLESRTL